MLVTGVHGAGREVEGHTLFINIHVSRLGASMPLAFESLSHGAIAFGFFNIETDFLLLERYFFFADSFYKKSISSNFIF
jgi:hypothetical protein